MLIPTLTYKQNSNITYSKDTQMFLLLFLQQNHATKILQGISIYKTETLQFPYMYEVDAETPEPPCAQR